MKKSNKRRRGAKALRKRFTSRRLYLAYMRSIGSKGGYALHRNYHMWPIGQNRFLYEKRDKPLENYPEEDVIPF